MGYTAFTFASILLGLLAWGLPVRAISFFQKKQLTKGIPYIFSSFVCALLSVLFVLLYRNHFIKIEDWTALIDTASGLQFASVFMIAITIALNGVALAIMKENRN